MRPCHRALRSLALGLALVTGWAAAEQSLSGGASCVMDSAALPAERQSERTAPAGFRLLQMDAAGLDSNLNLVCDGRQLRRLSLGLEAGQSRTLILVVESGAVMPPQVQPPLPETSGEGHWRVSFRPIEIDDEGSIRMRLFPGDQARVTELIEMTVMAGDSTRPGQRQELLITAADAGGKGPAVLHLVLEGMDGERMFRDNFQLDPKLGQFSLRRPRPTPERVNSQAGDVAGFYY